MKKIFTLFAVVMMALAANAQEPLYTITTKLAADPEWGDDYAEFFAFQGTEIKIDVYADDYIIIRNWAGAEGCDLKIEYDSTIDIDSDDCYGNILAMTTYINGEEKEPLIYSKEYTDENGVPYTINYVDLATGRADYAVASTSLNEDGTFYWSFVELDKEAKTGYVELSAYFMTADYNEDDVAAYYYFASWPEAADPVLYGTFKGELAELYTEEGELDDSYGTPYLTGLKDIEVEVYDTYAIIHDWSKNPESPRDLKVTCSHDDEQSLTSLVYINTTTGTETTMSTGKYFYTGYGKEADNLYDVYYVDGYSYADWDETSGYVIIMGYPYFYNEEGKLRVGDWGYYYLYWPMEDDNVTAPVKAQQMPAIYNIAGQRVSTPKQGVFIAGGKKLVITGK